MNEVGFTVSQCIDFVKNIQQQANDVIEIKNDNNVTILISLNKKFINQIKLSENKILVKNIEGYFDEKNI